MAKQRLPMAKACKGILPKVILFESQNEKTDHQQTTEEIRYFITQIILLADKIGRPPKNQCLEVKDAA
jgi:hypothetical protein